MVKKQTNKQKQNKTLLNLNKTIEVDSFVTAILISRNQNIP